MINIEVSISTFDKLVVQKSAHMLLIPAIGGDMGILPEHSLTITQLKFGVVKFCDNANKIFASFFVDSGVARINATNVDLICENVIEYEEAKNFIHNKQIQDNPFYNQIQEYFSK